MKNHLSIILAFLAVTGAGWLFVSGLISANHKENPGTASPVVSARNRLPMLDASNHRLATQKESSMIQDHGPLGESTNCQAVPSPAVSTLQAPEAVGLLSKSGQHSSPTHTPQSFSSANQIRQSTGSADHESIALDVPQPAVWVDLGAASSLSQEQLDEIQIMAESLSRKITESGLDPASTEYKQAWQKAVADSDQLFRQRYGNQAWMEHHIHAHHLAQSAKKSDP